MNLLHAAGVKRKLKFLLVLHTRILVIVAAQLAWLLESLTGVAQPRNQQPIDLLYDIVVRAHRLWSTGG